MLRRKHLDALKLANIPYIETFTKNNQSHFIVVDEKDIVDLIEYLHENFPEDKPIYPLRILENNEYWLYINDNNSKEELIKLHDHKI